MLYLSFEVIKHAVSIAGCQSHPVTAPQEQPTCPFDLFFNPNIYGLV